MTDQTKNKRPNILLITTDQHHWSSIGFNNPKIKTPNLDKLAREGTVFSRAYCTNPTCTPTRATLITGMYASQHGAWSLGTKLLDDVPTMGDALQKAGYRTALIGKAHFEPLKETSEFKSKESYPVMQDLAYWRNFHGPYYGFEYIELARNHTDEAHVGQHYAIWLEENGCTNWRDYFQKPTGNRNLFDRYKEAPHWQIPEKFHYNAWIAESSNRKLAEYAETGENFFLWASFLDPHAPRIVPSPWDTMYKPEDVEEVPEQNIKEHNKNPPHFRYVQVDGSSKGRFHRLKNNIKMLRNGKKLIEYHGDFRKHGLSVHGLHGMHPHHYNKEKLKKEIAAYYGMVSLIDKYVGAILDKLEELGLAENTIVIFTTDHGDFFGQHGLITKGPFHYEDLLKIPFIARYPDVIPANTTSDALLSLVDLPSTLHALANLPIPIEYTGIDQSKVFKGQVDSIRNHVLCEMRHSPEKVHLKSYVNEQYKITIYNQQKYGELFDLQEDPGEHNNLWDAPNSQALKADLLFRFVQAELNKDFNYGHPFSAEKTTAQ